MVRFLSGAIGSIPGKWSGMSQLSTNFSSRTHTVVRGFIPAGLRSSPKTLRSLRNRAGASSLATEWSAAVFMFPCRTFTRSRVALRHCLQLRQNPPACASGRPSISCSRHCSSVIGSASPSNTRRIAVKPIDTPVSINGGYVREIFGSAGFLVSRSCRPAHSCHPSSASDDWQRL